MNLRKTSPNKNGVYDVPIPQNPQAIVFVNGFIARNFKGLFWLWTNLFWIKSSVERAQGCFDLKAGICNPQEIVMVSWWDNYDSHHIKMMQYASKFPQNLSLYNETYNVTKSGKYTNEPNGIAKAYGQ